MSIGNDLILSLHTLGDMKAPSEQPTETEVAVYIRKLIDLDAHVDVAIRFAIGKAIMEQPWEHGEKFLFCEKHFGQRAIWVMECAAIARAWIWNQNVGWSWSHYKDLVKFDKDVKQLFVKHYNQGRLRTVAQLKIGRAHV